jgi:hypothetical protein
VCRMRLRGLAKDFTRFLYEDRALSASLRDPLILPKVGIASWPGTTETNVDGLVRRRRDLAPCQRLRLSLSPLALKSRPDGYVGLGLTCLSPQRTRLSKIFGPFSEARSDRK